VNNLGEDTLDDLAAKATAGDRVALDGLFRQIQRPVYQLAVRMLWNPEEAQDATQEILIKALTNLGKFERRSKFSTWVYRIAVNHLMTVRASRTERHELSWDAFGRDLSDGLAAGRSIEDALLVEEIKIGCTHAMLLCLDRSHRMAYILGEIVAFDGEEAARILRITPAAFRKRLSRARKEVAAFTQQWCGLLRPERPCRCERRVDRALSTGRVTVGQYQFAAAAHSGRNFAKVLETIRQLNAVQGTAELYRSHGDVRMPVNLLVNLDRLVAADQAD
jgi:RNA polymerase sigma factor (sigma-70 family)